MRGRSRDSQTKGPEVSPPLQRSPGRAELLAARKARARALSLHMWAAGLGCLQTLGTLFLRGTGQDLLPGSSDAGCCNRNCGGGVSFPYPSVKLSHGNIPPSGHSLQTWLCRKSELEGWSRWGAVGSARCRQSAVPGAMHRALSWSVVPGFLPKSLKPTFNTRSCALCSCCALAERVPFLLDVRVEQLFLVTAFLAIACINDTLPAVSHPAAFTFT